MPMDGFVEVCQFEDIRPSEPLIVEIEGVPIALCRIGNDVFALEDVCPHQAASFEGGEVEDGILVCPLHGWRADVRSGQSLEAPSIKIQQYQCRVEDGKVYVKV